MINLTVLFWIVFTIDSITYIILFISRYVVSYDSCKYYLLDDLRKLCQVIITNYLIFRYYYKLRTSKSLINDVEAMSIFIDELKAQTYLFEVQKLLNSLSNGFKANFPEILKQLRRIEHTLEQKIK